MPIPAFLNAIFIQKSFFGTMNPARGRQWISGAQFRPSGFPITKLFIRSGMMRLVGFHIFPLISITKKTLTKY
jgi:hypothetical protein